MSYKTDPPDQVEIHRCPKCRDYLEKVVFTNTKELYLWGEDREYEKDNDIYNLDIDKIQYSCSNTKCDWKLETKVEKYTGE